MSKEKYLAQFDVINRLSANWVDEDEEYALGTFEEMLIDAYLMGFSDTAFTLKTVVDAPLIDFLEQTYDGVSVREKFEEYHYAGDAEALNRLAESEYHRAYNTGAYAAASKAEGNVYKKWVTVGDTRVRETHDFLDGVKVPLGEKFYTIDGDSASYPGDFSNASNNANCRCWLEYEKE